MGLTFQMKTKGSVNAQGKADYQFQMSISQDLLIHLSSKVAINNYNYEDIPHSNLR